MTSKAMARKETNFKQTDIGLIPHDWEVVTIGDGFKFITNNTLSRSQLTSKGSVLNVHYGDVHVRFSEVLDLEKSTLPFINSGIRRNAKPYLINGDMVMTDTAEDETVGKSCEIQNVGEWKVEAGLHTFAMRPTQRYASRFLGYFINSKSFHSQLLPLIQGTKVYSVTKGDLKGTAVIKPPIEEQKRIAEVLSHFDEHIDNLVALLEKRKQVKAATMHALLSGATRLPGFTAPWKKRTIEQISNRYDNLRVPVAENLRVKGSTPYYGANGIQGYVQGYTHDGEYVLIAEDGANDLSNYPTQYIMGKIWVNNHAHVLQGKFGQCSTCFLSYALKTPNYKEIVVGGERAKLNAKNLMEIELFIPTKLEEQSAIASVLSNMDRGIEALEEQIEKYRQMKEGAMEELLTGKVRLI